MAPAPTYRSPLSTNFYDLQRLLPLQRGFFNAMLSAQGVPPEDFEAVSRRATDRVFGAPLGGEARQRPRGVF